MITDDGRLVWIVDGYATSQSHPYSAILPVAGLRGAPREPSRRQLASTAAPAPTSQQVPGIAPALAKRLQKLQKRAQQLVQEIQEIQKEAAKK